MPRLIPASSAALVASAHLAAASAWAAVGMIPDGYSGSAQSYAAEASEVAGWALENREHAADLACHAGGAWSAAAAAWRAAWTASGVLEPHDCMRARAIIYEQLALAEREAESVATL